MHAGLVQAVIISSRSDLEFFKFISRFRVAGTNVMLIVTSISVSCDTEKVAVSKKSRPPKDQELSKWDKTFQSELEYLISKNIVIKK